MIFKLTVCPCICKHSQTLILKTNTFFTDKKYLVEYFTKIQNTNINVYKFEEKKTKIEGIKTKLQSVKCLFSLT